MDQALQKKDLEAYVAVVGEGFKLHLADGRILNRDAVRESTRDFFKTGDVTSRTRIQSCTVNGNTAVVEAEARMDSTYTDPQEQKHTVSTDATSRDTWVKGTGGWQLTSSMEVSHATKRDGKPYKPDGSKGASK